MTSSDPSQSATADSTTLQVALDAASDAILAVDLDGNIMAFNRRFAAIWGITDDILKIGLHENALTFVLESIKDQQAFLDRIAEIYARPKLNYFDELEFKDGRIFERNYHPRLENGEVVGRIWSFRDVTEQKTSRKRLAQLSFGMDQMHDAAYLIAENARFVYVNNQSCKALGYPHHQLLQLSVFDIDPRFPREIWGSHWAELKQRRSITLETIHKTKDGRLFPVEVVANYFEYNHVGYNLAIARDISERKNIEEAL